MRCQPLLLAALALSAQAVIRPKPSHSNDDDDDSGAAITSPPVATSDVDDDDAASSTAAPATTASSPTTTKRSTTSRISTIQVMLGQNIPASADYAASIIGVDACDTTFQLRCTDDCTLAGTASSITVTQNPSAQTLAFPVVTDDASFQYSAACAITGTTGAVCTVVQSGSVAGQTTLATTTTALVGAGLRFTAVSVTAGAEKLSSASGKCTRSDGAAAPAPTAALKAMVYKVLVPVGAMAGAVAIL